MIILEHNVTTGEIVEREATAEELAQSVIDETESATRLAEIENKATAKAAVLTQLGITAEQAKLLLS
jgi:hypothetical protein